MLNINNNEPINIGKKSITNDEILIIDNITNDEILIIDNITNDAILIIDNINDIDNF